MSKLVERNKNSIISSDCKCAKRSLTDLAGESPVVEEEPVSLRSESCVIVGNESDEA